MVSPKNPIMPLIQHLDDPIMPLTQNLDDPCSRRSAWIGGVPSTSKTPASMDVLQGLRKPSLEPKTICHLIRMPRGTSKKMDSSHVHKANMKQKFATSFIRSCSIFQSVLSLSVRIKDIVRQCDTWIPSIGVHILDVFPVPTTIINHTYTMVADIYSMLC